MTLRENTEIISSKFGCHGVSRVLKKFLCNSPVKIIITEIYPILVVPVVENYKENIFRKLRKDFQSPFPPAFDM